MATTLPSVTITPKGADAPSEAAILAWFQAAINAHFGGKLSQNLETPQGQLASSLSAIVADKNAQFAYFLNQIHPDYAEGLFQDVLARIYYLRRKAAAQSTAQLSIMGAVGTVVPIEFAAKDAAGNIWQLSESVTIPSSGTATANAKCLTAGAVIAAAGTINNIHHAVIGVDRVTNTQDATVGYDEESRAELAYRRQNSTEVNANGINGAVYGAVYNLDNVTDVYVTDNRKDTAQTVGATNYSLLPHSIYVAVVGGDNAEIAKTIWQKIDMGCNYNGNTTVQVEDESYDAPRPTYGIQFHRPAPLPLFFFVVMEASGTLPNDYATLARNAIIAALSNRASGVFGRIAGHVHALKFAPIVQAAMPNEHVISIAVGTAANPSGASVLCGIDQYPTISAANIAVSAA